MRTILAFAVSLAALAGCSKWTSDPGPLGGTWKSAAVPNLPTIEFRSGESVSMGISDRVEFFVEPNPQVKTIVRVKYLTGIAPGTVAEFHVIPGAGVARLGSVEYKKVK